MKQAICGLLLATLLAVPVAAAAKVRVIIVEWGEMEVQRSDSPLGPEFEEHSLGPGYQSAESHFINHDDSVPAELCRSFGFRAWVAAGPDEALPKRVLLDLHHPVMTRPDGASATETTLSLPVRLGEIGSAYTLDEPWEAVPGTWTFDLVLDGEVVASKTMELTPPEPGQAAKPCPGRAIS
jgi:hypothetical protein